ncbi:hypothetical protein GGR52DRAFT_574914 [Hypoxylon sp. FL1284]|nr:hypothetical protein GGR52DRAFT_574914 [Hypoxylon sp. FL1284]
MATNGWTPAYSKGTAAGGDFFRELLLFCDDTKAFQINTIGSQQDILTVIREQSEKNTSALKATGETLDAHEDELDAMAEDISSLKATVESLQARLQRIKTCGIKTQTAPPRSEKIHRSVVKVSDEELYRRLCKIAAPARAWLYQNHDGERQPDSDDVLVRKFVERATAAGIRVGRRP